MGIPEIIIIGIGLSFDTFAVSISIGLLKNFIKFWQGIRVAIVLTLFQVSMPLAGWLGGIQIVKYMSSIDHWIAFGLLTIVGVNIIVGSFKEDEEKKVNPLVFGVLVLMGLATSIDALVVGVSFAFIDVNIYQSVLIVGIITFICAMAGMLIGKCANGKFGKRVEIFSGLILIALGTKILIEHLG
jgi:putative Mn2+ efflux pump MntP